MHIYLSNYTELIQFMEFSYDKKKKKNLISLQFEMQ